MVVVLGDLIADLSLRIADFPIHAQDLKPVSYLEVGPGGATNIAIMAARFGLPVTRLGEMGNDTFGDIVRAGLKREGIDTRRIIITDESKTPVAGVIVDEKREPAYLGYLGKLVVRALPEAWHAPVKAADALFADGWIEIAEMPRMILDAFRMARAAGVKTFFDPGPGNGAFDLTWHLEAAALATVLLVNEEEARRLTRIKDALAAARQLVQNGTELVVLKRSEDGLTVFTAEQEYAVGGFQVEARDFTGAGDSVTGAMLYGYLKGLDLETLGILGNATGATKVQKLGTGHNMPTLAEIRATLARYAPAYANLI